MKIAVLNYESGVVDIVVVDSAYLRDNYKDSQDPAGDYLIDELGYHESSIHWMAGVNGLNIIDQDELNQVLSL